MTHGAVEFYADEKAIEKSVRAHSVTSKTSGDKARKSFVIDAEKELDLTEFETVLFSFKAISRYKLQLLEQHQLIIQIAVTTGHRFDDFDQSLALRVGQYFKSKSIGNLRFLIQEV